MAKSIVLFAPELSVQQDPDPEILGRKGANLVTLCNSGFPVPPGFVIGTDSARKFRRKGRLGNKLIEEVREALGWLQETSARQFGAHRRPLLLAVRSGAPASMPGMMDTILNIGLNDETVRGLERLSGNPRFAWDSYRRLVTMYGDTVLGFPRSRAEETLARFRQDQSVEHDWELDAAALRRLTKSLRSEILKHCSVEFPQDPETQLFSAIEAVFNSWDSDRSQAYRAMHDIEDTGTAVTVQAMVFGNAGASSGSGVAFSRNPSTGENRMCSEFLYNAQGEDVVSGSRSPDGGEFLEKGNPDAYRHLRTISRQLEDHFRDIVDIEFTIEDGSLYLLQARIAKRSPAAALCIAVSMVEEGLISVEEALERLGSIALEDLKVKRLLPPANVQPIARGTVASTGVAVGKIAFSPSRATEMRADGKDVILVREETQAEDVEGMKPCIGFLTARGGMTSHAAVVARQLGLCCIVGCEDLRFEADGTVTLNGVLLSEEQSISLDGHSGQIYATAVPVGSAEDYPEMERLRSWARRSGVSLGF